MLLRGALCEEPEIIAKHCHGLSRPRLSVAQYRCVVSLQRAFNSGEHCLKHCLLVFVVQCLLHLVHPLHTSRRLDTYAAFVLVYVNAHVGTTLTIKYRSNASNDRHAVTGTHGDVSKKAVQK